MATSILGPEWHISTEGLNIITENGTIKDTKKVYKFALDTDIKVIGKPVLVNELSKEKSSKIVLQIQKIRNISAPKANENSQAAPRMLKLTLTDGDSYVQAIEITPIQSISRDKTAPGTKVLINGAKICSGYFLITPNTCTVLGGEVPHLHEKWLLAKSVQHNRQNASNDGPPAWVNFGCKIQVGNQENNFKSLDNKNKDSSKENTEFEQQRQEAIAEAATGAVKKTFGGRVKQNVQPTVNQNQYKRFEFKDKPERGRKGKTLIRERDIEDKPLKPSEKVSLFAFLEDKLPVNETKVVNDFSYSYQNQSHTNRNSDNNIQYSQRSQQNFAQNNQYRKDYHQPSNRPNNLNNIPRQNERPMQPNNYQKPNYRQNTQQDGFVKNNQSYAKTNADQYSRQNFNSQQGNNNYQKQFDKPSPVQQPHQKVQNNKDTNKLVDNFSKMSVNNEFASRSLRQHLNLGPLKKNEDVPKKNENLSNSYLNVGEECMAKYWEDGKFYNAIVTAVTDKTFAVRFKGYGNIEEVLKADCLPINNFKQQTSGYQKISSNNRSYSGSMEFRRSAKK